MRQDIVRWGIVSKGVSVSSNLPMEAHQIRHVVVRSLEVLRGELG